MVVGDGWGFGLGWMWVWVGGGEEYETEFARIFIVLPSAHAKTLELITFM